MNCSITLDITSLYAWQRIVFNHQHELTSPEVSLFTFSHSSEMAGSVKSTPEERLAVYSSFLVGSMTPCCCSLCTLLQQPSPISSLFLFCDSRLTSLPVSWSISQPQNKEFQASYERLSRPLLSSEELFFSSSSTEMRCARRGG